MSELSVQEIDDFSRLDILVSNGLKTFVQVGNALKEIRDRQLYRMNYSTFEDYTEKRHGMKRAHAYRLIESGVVVTRLKSIDSNPFERELENEMSPTGDKLPSNERQTRELAKAPPEQQAEVWQETVKRSEETGKPVTAATVKEVVQERSGNLAHMHEVKPAKKPDALIDKPLKFDVDDAQDDLFDMLRTQLHRWPEGSKDVAAYVIADVCKEYDIDFAVKNHLN